MAPLSLARLTTTRPRNPRRLDTVACGSRRGATHLARRPVALPSLPAIGIEEELFVIDAATHDCVAEMPDAFFAEAEAVLGGAVKREIIASMIELVTGRHHCMAAARDELSANRRKLAAIAGRHGLALLACGTHPFADWQAQHLTDKPRYGEVARALGALSRRVHACGLHVHVEIPDRELRISVMNRMQRFLPLFLALSASSPFWRGAPTGLASYRSAANDETPRTGLPIRFVDDTDFRLFVAKMTAAGFIPDESFLWWSIRPSLKYPTLELRISDCCTDPGHAIAIAALYRCLACKLATDPDFATEWRDHHYPINGENRWQAIRHGLAARLMDPSTAVTRPVAEIVSELVQSLEPVARRLGCAAELASVEHILRYGTSADRQSAIYEHALVSGADTTAAIRRVTDWVIEETRAA